jgi:hypothetical protein
MAAPSALRGYADAAQHPALAKAIDLHLVRSAQIGATDTRAVVFSDKAGWHASANLEVPDTVTLMPMPAKAPPPNAVEKDWQCRRADCYSSRVPESGDGLPDRCRHARDRLRGRPWPSGPSGGTLGPGDHDPAQLASISWLICPCLPRVGGAGQDCKDERQPALFPACVSSLERGMRQTERGGNGLG